MRLPRLFRRKKKPVTDLYNPDEPDLAHEEPGVATTDPHDLEPPEGVDPNPGDFPDNLPDPEAG